MKSIFVTYMSIAIDKSVAIDMSRILMLESELSELRLLINTRVLDKTKESSMTERDQGDNFLMTICSIFLSDDLAVYDTYDSQTTKQMHIMSNLS